MAGEIKDGNDPDWGGTATAWAEKAWVCGGGACIRRGRGAAPEHKKRAAAKAEHAPAPAAEEPAVLPVYDGAGLRADADAVAATAAAAQPTAAQHLAECMAQRFAGGASVRGSGLSAVAKIVGHRLCDPAKLYGQARMPAAEHNFEMELRFDGFEPELLVWGAFDDGDGAAVMDVRFVPEADVYAIADDPAEVLEDVETYFSHFSAQTAKHAKAGAELLQRAYVVCDSTVVRFQLATYKEKEAKAAAAEAGRAAKRAATAKTAAVASAEAAAAKAAAAKASEAAAFAQVEAERMTEAAAEAQAAKASAAKEAREARIPGAPTAAPTAAPTTASAAAPASSAGGGASSAGGGASSAGGGAVREARIPGARTAVPMAAPAEVAPTAAPTAVSNAARKRPMPAASQGSPAKQPAVAAGSIASPRRGRSSGLVGPAADVEAEWTPFCQQCGRRNAGPHTSTHANTGGDESWCTCGTQ